MKFSPLCLGTCLDKAHNRINGAIAHNPSRSVEWWAAWWDKEISRQLEDRARHGCL